MCTRTEAFYSYHTSDIHRSVHVYTHTHTHTQASNYLLSSTYETHMKTYVYSHFWQQQGTQLTVGNRLLCQYQLLGLRCWKHTVSWQYVSDKDPASILCPDSMFQTLFRASIIDTGFASIFCFRHVLAVCFRQRSCQFVCRRVSPECFKHCFVPV